MVIEHESAAGERRGESMLGRCIAQAIEHELAWVSGVTEGVIAGGLDPLRIAAGAWPRAWPR